MLYGCEAAGPLPCSKAGREEPSISTGLRLSAVEGAAALAAGVDWHQERREAAASASGRAALDLAVSTLEEVG